MNMSINYTASWTQICNSALARLGSEPIKDLTDTSNGAIFCNRFLPQAVEYVLGQWNFTFARRRQKLAMNAEEPLFGWNYQFNCPKDLIRLIEVIGGNNKTPTQSELVPYQVENGMILTNSDSIYITYIARPDNPNQLSHSARNAISTHLAFLLSTPLTASEQLISFLAAESQRAIEQAKTEDAHMNYDPYAHGQDFHVEKR